MQSVTSNAVASALEYSEYEDTTNKIMAYRWGKVVYVTLRTRVTSTSPHIIYTAIPTKFRPTKNEARTAFMNNSSDVPVGQAIIRMTSGDIYLYLGNGGSFGTMDCIADWCYIVD